MGRVVRSVGTWVDYVVLCTLSIHNLTLKTRFIRVFPILPNPAWRTNGTIFPGFAPYITPVPVFPLAAALCFSHSCARSHFHRIPWFSNWPRGRQPPPTSTRSCGGIWLIYRNCYPSLPFTPDKGYESLEQAAIVPLS